MVNSCPYMCNFYTWEILIHNGQFLYLYVIVVLYIAWIDTFFYFLNANIFLFLTLWNMHLHVFSKDVQKFKKKNCYKYIYFYVQ